MEKLLSNFTLDELSQLSLSEQQETLRLAHNEEMTRLENEIEEIKHEYELAIERILQAIKEKKLELQLARQQRLNDLRAKRDKIKVILKKQTQDIKRLGEQFSKPEKIVQETVTTQRRTWWLSSPKTEYKQDKTVDEFSPSKINSLRLEVKRLTLDNDNMLKQLDLGSADN